ncbi:MAG: hypothetical protein ACFFDT_33675 [Candidatus Hodarchaeota archaeon]
MSEEGSKSSVLPSYRFFRFILPVLAIILLSGTLAQYTMTIYYPDPEEPPISITPVQTENAAHEEEIGLLNAIIYVSLALIGGFIVLYLLRYGLESILKILFLGVIAMASFVMGLWYFSPLIYITFYSLFPSTRFLAPFVSYWYSMVLSLLYGGFAAFIMNSSGKRIQTIRNLFLILFGAQLGAFMGIHFKLWDTIFALILLSLYDIYAVFKGPIRGILEESENDFTIDESKLNEGGLIASDEDIENIEGSRQLFPILPIYISGEIVIGLGDFVFYALLVGFAIKLGIIVLFIGLAVLLGAIITYKLLEKRSALPGLPISMFLGVSILLIDSFVI